MVQFYSNSDVNLRWRFLNFAMLLTLRICIILTSGHLRRSFAASKFFATNWYVALLTLYCYGIHRKFIAGINKATLGALCCNMVVCRSVWLCCVYWFVVEIDQTREKYNDAVLWPPLCQCTFSMFGIFQQQINTSRALWRRPSVAVRNWWKFDCLIVDH